ncbi:dolichyl-phosphate-mannose--protein mannosyltransferase [Anaeramoeba flamelloides]|uniref:Dolichyl-phosphate-mannose--protein mannosyltransferase n=1 Tax=Anaeramoeba flamelloides TaxID=1746091 RepID=A0AAV7YWW9_9EUKA|nr:dolichyl-phosphate-mannose--protein mannosyltransferase [Anaeramoeba flamelloides]
MKKEKKPNLYSKKFQSLCDLSQKCDFNLEKTQKAHDSLTFVHFSLDIVFALVIFIVSLYTRFWRLSEPNQVVFDEVHFGGFINKFLKGDYFFDIHPPLAKLIHASLAKACHLTPDFGYSNIGDEYPEGYSYMCIRSADALISSFIAPIFYYTLRTIGISVPVSILTGLMMAFENATIVESRMIVTDSFLFFFVALTIFFDVHASKLRPRSKNWYFFLTLTGLSAGCAFSIKLTSGGLLIALGILHIIRSINEIELGSLNIKRLFNNVKTRAIILLAMVSSILLMSWYFHFGLLPYKTEDTDSMSDKFKAGFVDTNTNIIPHSVGSSSFFSKVVELNVRMHSQNMRIGSQHPYGSVWYEWPFHTCTALRLWDTKVEQTEAGCSRSMYCIGNFVVWWFSATGAIIGILFLIFKGILIISPNIIQQEKIYREYQKKDANGKIHYYLRNIYFYGQNNYFKHILSSFGDTLGFLVTGYILSLLPFVFITRDTWLYHYIPPLIFAILIFGVVLDMILRVFVPIKLIKISLLIILLSAVYFGWHFLRPLVYAITFDDPDFQKRFMFMSWRP